MGAHARNHAVLDEIDWVCGPRVFGEAVIGVVRYARFRIQRHVLENGPEAQRVPDLRLFVRRELNALGVASALEVEDAVAAPSVFVVADEITRRVGGERSLARARKPKKQRR